MAAKRRKKAKKRATKRKATRRKKTTRKRKTTTGKTKRKATRRKTTKRRKKTTRRKAKKKTTKRKKANVGKVAVVAQEDVPQDVQPMLRGETPESTVKPSTEPAETPGMESSEASTPTPPPPRTGPSEDS